MIRVVVLSLHSTMFLLIRYTLHCPVRFAIVFTFHYVSINTQPLLSPVRCSYAFTFHYVSINTILTMFHRCSLLTLHSTMFLLIRRPDRYRVEGYKSLHSTMFLLIRMRVLLGDPDHLPLHSTMFLLIRFSVCGWSSDLFNFTFHYVSINTTL